MEEAVAGIIKLRELHVQMDNAVLEAYGWQDIALRHDYYEVDYLPENDRVRFKSLELPAGGEADGLLPRGITAVDQMRRQDAVVFGFAGEDHDIAHFVETWLPAYIRDNRSYLTVGIGCTGGQHRSVYIAEWLARHFADRARVLVRHRELTPALTGAA